MILLISPLVKPFFRNLSLGYHFSGQKKEARASFLTSMNLFEQQSLLPTGCLGLLSPQIAHCEVAVNHRD